MAVKKVDAGKSNGALTSQKFSFASVKKEVQRQQTNKTAAALNTYVLENDKNILSNLPLTKK